MDHLQRILVAGHKGMVGSAIVRRMQAEGLPPPILDERAPADLRDQAATRRMLEQTRPTALIIAAAKVGGIEANRTQPASFLFDNLAIAANLIDGAYRCGIPRVLFLGSSCIYPRLAPQPIPEDALLAGPLEPTNEAYAIAKIAGLKLCQAYRRQYGVCYHSAMPTNLFGPGDNYNLESSHVMPALIRRFEEARETGAPVVTVWGTGTPLREFLHVDDVASAILFLLRHPNPPDWVNVGSGQEVSIRQLAELVRDACGARCEIVLDATKPDGTPRKLIDCARLHGLGWKPSLTLDEGIRRTVLAYREEKVAGRRRG
ncbi:MAG: GDP-L-fucose synthase [bacterium]